MSTQRKVTYLIGAGGSHGCIAALNSTSGLLMKHLVPSVAEKVKELVQSKEEFSSLLGVVNEVVTATADIEQLITFFDESPSSSHRRFAEELRWIFETVLTSTLTEIETELGPDRVNLYAALLDMYTLEGFDEVLRGILTLNYDDYIENAVGQICGCADQVEAGPGGRLGGENGWRLLKLHGSFGWAEAWPIERRTIASSTNPLWIPPGIKKGKERYPFNLLWGLARDALNCDVVRVIGCQLGPSDWDLISLLFGTRHANSDRDKPYKIEIIDSPWQAESLKAAYPFLDVKSIFEIETLDVGRSIVSDVTAGKVCEFDSLSEDEKTALAKRFRGSNENWFKMWLATMVGGLYSELGERAMGPPRRPLRRWLEI